MGFLPPPFNAPIFGMDATLVYGTLFGALFILLMLRALLPYLNTVKEEKQQKKSENKIKSSDNLKDKTFDEHPMGDKTHD